MLDYAASPTIRKFDSSASVGVGAVKDQRGNGPNWIGAVRGGYGNPLKVLETEKPVKALVAEVIDAGLQARGVLDLQNPTYRLDIDLITLSSSQYVRREAHVEIRANVVEAKTGATVHTATGKSDLVEGSVLALNAGHSC